MKDYHAALKVGDEEEFTPKEVADMLGTTLVTVYNWIRKEELKTFQTRDRRHHIKGKDIKESLGYARNSYEERFNEY